MLATDYQRPPQLYFYGPRASLQLALQEGQFCLQVHGDGSSACLTLSFCQAFKPEMLQQVDAADSCLVIHQSEQFGERLHAAVQRLLPSWVGIDGAVQYGSRSPLGALFSKPVELASQQEWLFAWRATQLPRGAAKLHPLLIKLGNLEKLAQLRERDTGSC